MIDLRDRRGRITRLVIALLAGWFGGYASSFAIAAVHLEMPKHMTMHNELPIYGAIAVGIGVVAAVHAIASWRAKQVSHVAQARVR